MNEKIYNYGYIVENPLLPGNDGKKKFTKSLNWLTDIVMPNEYFKITHA